MKKCSNCSKPATLHITELRHGAVQALHLCEACAQEYLTSSPLSDSSDPDALAEKFGQTPDDDLLREYEDLVCPNCGLSFREFRRQGRLGCPHDYVAFEDELLPLLENIHGERQHVGKFPKRAPDASKRQYELIRLRNELKAAVDDEEYEAAAKLRDKIQAIKTDMDPAETE
jgi:protein arginine kinase activator